MVQALCPDPVAVVLAVLPVQVLLKDPEAAALPRLVVQLVKSVFTADKIPMMSPTTGFVLDVIVVFV
jgi:hypothetical protein